MIARYIEIVGIRPEAMHAEIRRAKPQHMHNEEKAVQRKEAHVMVHHQIKGIAADCQRKAAFADIRRKQAGNAQIKRNRQRRARVNAERIADKVRAIRKQVCQILISRTEQRTQDDDADEIRHGGQMVAPLQHAAIEHAARKPRQKNHRAQH